MRNPEGKGTLGRPRCRWVNNIKVGLRWDVVVWTGLVWLRIGTGGGCCCEHGNEPPGSVECWEVLE
jgi:hypothetical protein